MTTVEWLSDKATFSDLVELNVSLTAYGYGLEIKINLSNITSTIKPSANQIYPHFILAVEPSINLTFASTKKEPRSLILIESKIGLWNIYNKNKRTDIASLLVLPGQSTYDLDYFALVRPDQWIKMKQVAEKEGVVEFNISLSISFDYRKTMIEHDFYLWHPEVVITASKVQLEEFVATWAKSKESLIDLPENLPNEILRDMVEASKCLDIEASKAAATMARRALQQTLIEKGADKSKNLYDQIVYFEKEGLLTPDIVNLAHGIRFLGNYGAHPESDPLKDVTLEDAKLSFLIISKIMRQLYPK